jgi:hypothetical protein
MGCMALRLPWGGAGRVRAQCPTRAAGSVGADLARASAVETSGVAGSSAVANSAVASGAIASSAIETRSVDVASRAAAEQLAGARATRTEHSAGETAAERLPGTNAVALTVTRLAGVPGSSRPRVNRETVCLVLVTALALLGCGAQQERPRGPALRYERAPLLPWDAGVAAVGLEAEDNPNPDQRRAGNH